jgi:hypothetical protein
MKKFLLSASVVAGLFAQPTVDQLQKQIEQLQQQLNQLKTSQQKVEKKVDEQNDRYYKKVSPVVANSHLFFSLDLRSAYDVITKETTDGFGYKAIPNFYNPGTFTVKDFNPQEKKTHTGQVWSNRFIVTGIAKPSDNLKATIQLQMDKVFGPASDINMLDAPFQNFDWVSNEDADDNTVRVKAAWFNYYFGPDNGLMFSIGRRPSTEGFPANLKSEDEPNHPPAHMVNMEFDGISTEANSDALSHLWSKFGDWGTSLLLCMGRGMSNTNGKWSLNSNQPGYTKSNDKAHADFAGFMLTPYNDGQYSLKWLSMWATHMMGFKMNIPNQMYAMMHEMSAQQIYSAMMNGIIPPMNEINASMEDLGNFYGTDFTFEAQGIGDGISDFLDNTTAFIDFGLTETRPRSGQRMLGSTKKEIGRSIWVGADMPGIGDNDRFGVNYAHGSKYWRNFTYGEDTLAGSIPAVRGNAWDVYYNHQIIPNLTLQLRYSYLKYSNPGSDGFFGDMGDPDFKAFSWVDKATDLRAYIRYNF